MRHIALEWFVLSALAVLCAAPAASPADIPSYLVPFSGPTDHGLAFGAASGLLVINNSGQISVAWPSVCTLSDGMLQPVIPSGTVAPGAGGLAITGNYGLIVNDAGMFGLYGTLNGGGSSANSGYWVGHVAADLQKVMRKGDPANGFPGQTFTGDPYAAFNNQVSLGVSRSGGSGIWKGTTVNDLAPFAQTGDLAPGAGGATFSSISTPAPISANGQILFNANLTSGSGIWRGSSSADLQLVARTTQHAPDTEAAATFSAFNYVSTNNTGAAAFSARLGGVTSASGIWSDRSGSLHLLLRENDPAPLVSPTAKFNLAYAGVYLTNSGRIGFNCRLTDGAATADAVFVETDDGYQLAAREGDLAPGCGGTTLSNLWWPQFNARGQMLVKSELSDGGRGLFFYDPTLGLQLLARTGTSREIAPGLFKTIDRVDDYGNGTGGGDGLPRALNDNGQVVFNLHFTDNTWGVFTTPEPASLALVLPAALAALRRQRPRPGPAQPAPRAPGNSPRRKP